jgi:hypothetical protein
MGVVVPPSTTIKMRKNKKLCSWIICSICFWYFRPPNNKIQDKKQRKKRFFWSSVG